MKELCRVIAAILMIFTLISGLAMLFFCFVTTTHSESVIWDDYSHERHLSYISIPDPPTADNLIKFLICLMAYFIFGCSCSILANYAYRDDSKPQNDPPDNLSDKK